MREDCVSAFIHFVCITIAMHSLLAFVFEGVDIHIYRLEIRRLSTSAFALSLGQSEMKKGFAIQQKLQIIVATSSVISQKIKSFFLLVFVQSRDFQSFQYWTLFQTIIVGIEH